MPAPRIANSWLVAGLLVGAALRLWLVPVPGSPDVGSWKIWAVVGSTDPTSLYGVGGSPPERRLLSWNGVSGTTEYPPLALYQMGLVGAVYSRVDPALGDSRTFTALIKAPGLVFELLFVASVWFWRRHFGGGARWIMLAFWLNPAILVNGAALGYLDAQMAVPASLALVAAAVGSPHLAGALLAAAVLTKAQALFIGPAILLAVVGNRASARRSVVLAAAGGAAVAALVLGPIIVRGAWPNMIQALERLGAHDMVSGYGLNAWWIVTWLIRATHALSDLDWQTAFTMPVRILGIQRMVEVGYPNPKPIGAVIVVAGIAWACWQSRHVRSLSNTAALGAWCVYVYAMFSAQVHENHAYLAVPFLALAAGVDRRWRRIFWAVSVMTALNMYVFYGLGDGAPPLIGRAWSVVDLTVLLAAANLAIFAGFTRGLLRATRVRP